MTEIKLSLEKISDQHAEVYLGSAMDLVGKGFNTLMPRDAQAWMRG